MISNPTYMMNRMSAVTPNSQPAGASKGGGQAQKPASQGGRQPNMFKMSANNMRNAIRGARQGMNYIPGQIANTNMQPYMNKYDNQVVNRFQGDLARQNRMAVNDMDAAATRASAFGGSRHGVAQALTNQEFAKTGADMAANLRQQGYNNAQNMAQFDINTGMQAAQNRMQGAQNLAGIANTAFNQANTVQNNLQRTGDAQQQVEQAVIDAGKQQFDNWNQHPQNTLQYLISALSGTKVPQSTTTTKNPGLFDYLTMFAGM